MEIKNILLRHSNARVKLNKAREKTELEQAFAMNIFDGKCLEN